MSEIAKPDATPDWPRTNQAEVAANVEQAIAGPTAPSAVVVIDGSLRIDLVSLVMLPVRMKSAFRMFFFTATLGALFAGIVLAHHSAAAYDVAQYVTVTGTITEFRFVNPHVLIYITATDEGGTTRKWQGELTSPNRLIRAGWNKDVIKVGDAVTLTGYPAKDGGNSLRLTKVVLQGRELKMDIE